MSEENVEIVRRSLDAFVREDWSALLEGLDAEIEIDDTDIPDADDYRGHEAFFKWQTRWNESWASSRMEDIEVLAGREDYVIALFRQVVEGRGSSIELERQDAMVCKVRGGKIVRIGYYNDQEKARKDAGLPV
ncbi:MAG: nuclear transport factor 2 family protein [Rubrobacteraceae bacterium]|nr:nuclear transport factor 2 family protein [Rubrobacteraceae bacterium]